MTVNAKVLKQHYDAHLEIKSGEAANEHFLTTALALWNALFSVLKLKDPRLHSSTVVSGMSVGGERFQHTKVATTNFASTAALSAHYADYWI